VADRKEKGRKKEANELEVMKERRKRSGKQKEKERKYSTISTGRKEINCDRGKSWRKRRGSAGTEDGRKEGKMD
jgi:hypothetical protein